MGQDLGPNQEVRVRDTAGTIKAQKVGALSGPLVQPLTSLKPVCLRRCAYTLPLLLLQALASAGNKLTGMGWEGVFVLPSAIGLPAWRPSTV